MKNWLSECLIANVALLETSWVWVRCFSWSNHEEAPTCLSVRKRAWKDGVAASRGPGYRSAACILQPCGKADLPKSRDDVCLSPFAATIWVMPLGPSTEALCSFSPPPELKTRVDPGASPVAPPQSPPQWTAWPSPWLVRPPGLPLCTLCSAWMTAAASRHHGNSLRPSQRGTPPRGWAPPTRLWAPACGLQPGTRRMKVSPGEGGGCPAGLWMLTSGLWVPCTHCRPGIFLIELNPSLACQGPLNH